MKRFFYATALFLMVSVWANAQTIFNNNGGDNLWSNDANWSAGLPDETDTYAQINNDVSLDANSTVLQIRSVNNTVNAGAGKVTITGTAAGLLQTGAVGTFTVDAAVDINGSGVKNLQVNATDGKLVFGPNSTLTLLNFAQVIALKTANREVQFNGALEGTSALRFGNNSNSSFGATANNANFDSELVFYAGAVVTVNMADNSTFIKAEKKVQINGTGGSLTLNGANVYKGNLSIGGANAFTLDVNQNQNDFGAIALAVDGTLTINMDAAVTNLSFINTSSYNWGTGSVVINGFKENVIRFGTDASGLTIEQLGQINVGGQSVMLDADGYLVYGTPTDIETTPSMIVERNSYPTQTSGLVNFKTAVEGVKVVSITGNIVENIADEVRSIDLSNLSSGIYFIVYADNSIEKIIKQ
ncbi:T9SS type A sorting domain-containing protein [Labilibacter sediminis]|nr:T9SS type A sorting domain-containing protein [Labilibacter sediminis]